MRPKWPVALFLLAMLGACALALAWWPTPPAEPPRMTGEPEPRLAYRRLGFEDLTGWAADDHGAAWGAFRRSCLRIDAAARARPHNEARPLDAVCRRALDLPEEPSSAAARAFFERHFTPYAVAGRDSGGFLTGYFEPALAGARTPSAEFSVPLYARPNDLVTQGTGLERARLNDRLSAARKTGDGLEPYPTRREIEEGALAGRGLELLYLADRVDAFILHVQGSGLIALEDGSHVRVGYAAKNGHPYTSIGRILVQRGAVTLEDMSLETLTDWLRADPERGRALMWENDSFIFFRELPAEEAEQGPVGAQGASLTPGRSLAVDASHHSLGTPIWVESETLDSHGEPGFRRLMIAQDVGSAIRGSERGDIYWGSGPEAGRVAGLTRHAGRFTVLLPTGAEPDV